MNKLKPKKQFLEGSRAISQIITKIAPAVVSAYPITPQTHIVEDLAQSKADGYSNFEYTRAESEFAAASIVLGASATGVRVYSATSSQGLLLMTEVLYNIAGMRLPVVITCANRAISAPINIWNDHSDVMSIRDAGWIQFFATTTQEAVYQHILAYKVAESLKLPTMINIDGFILTHSYDSVIIPDKKTLKTYLPDYKPQTGTYLDPKNPVTLGGFFGPNSYMETRENLYQDLKNSLKTIKAEYKLLKQKIGIKKSWPTPKTFKHLDNGLIEYYGPNSAQNILVAMGSMTGTILEVIKKRKDTALLIIKVWRPFPNEEIAKIITNFKNIAVLEKAVSPGQAGPLYLDMAVALMPIKIKINNFKNYIVGLGGRDVTEKNINEIIKDVHSSSNKSFLKFMGK